MSEAALSEKTATTTPTTHYKFALFIILAGVLFSLFLQWHIQDEIFFSGDAGLKALLAKQFSNGNFSFDLQIPAEGWVRDIWDLGLYPFAPPFAYKISNLYYITFPFTFPIITAPFYALFGLRGFYIVPLIATWSLWAGLYLVCRHFKFGSTITSIVITTLIFASPLTMYSSMYWEHTLAVSLAFNGLAILLVRGDSGKISTTDAVLSGLLLGLSVWFREEFLCLVGIIFVLVTASGKLKLGQLTLMTEKKIIFILSMILTVCLFLGINTIIYHHPLGIHSIQVVEKLSLVDRVSTGYKIFLKMTEELLTYFPSIYFCVVYVTLALFYNSQIKLPSVTKKLLVIGTLFAVSVAIVLPSDGGKQWGARFLLILIPFVCLVAATALQSTGKIKKFGFKYIVLVLFTTFFGIGFHINTYLGTIYCYPGRESPTLTTLKILRQDKNEVVAAPNQYVTQTFESLMDKKAFFLTKKSEDLIKLGSELYNQGYQKFTYICPSYDACYSSKKKPENLKFMVGGKTLSIELAKIATIEKKIAESGKVSGLEKKLRKSEGYMLYEARIADIGQKTNGSFNGESVSSSNRTKG